MMYSKIYSNAHFLISNLLRYKKLQNLFALGIDYNIYIEMKHFCEGDIFISYLKILEKY